MQTYYVKTFSKGQMTIPKKIRQKWGVEDEFWLQLKFGESNTLELQPMKKENDATAIIERLQALPPPEPGWFDPAEMKKTHQEAEKNLQQKLGKW